MTIETSIFKANVGHEGNAGQIALEGLESDLVKAPIRGIATGSTYSCVDKVKIFKFVRKYEDDVEVDGEWIQWV